jgi:membrane protease YdiL (CAAX protease family)
MEDTGIGSTASFTVLNHEVKNWQIIAVPLIAIMIAEILQYTGDLKACIFLHVVILLSLILSPVWISESSTGNSLQALALLPLLRLLNISMPVFSETTLYMFIFIYTPLLVTCYLIARHQLIPLFQEENTLKNLYIYVPLALLTGYFIGLAEWHTINAGNLIPDLSLKSLLELSFVMILVVGFTEELIFRSLLQTRLQTSFGMKNGLLITSIMFGIMHAGYGSFYELLITASAGILLGYMFQKTGSLVLVSFTHGFVNIFLFGLIPLLGPGLGLF